MNTISKVSVAGALALGFGVAHASILDPASGGDILLFAEVLNSSNSVVGSYAGDSGLLVGSTLGAGTVGNLSTSADSALSQLMTVAESSGNTLEWAVIGAKVSSAGNWTSTDQFVTTVATAPNGNVAQLALRTGTNTAAWSLGLTNDINAIDVNSNGANSVFAASIAAGGLFNPAAAGPNVASLYSQGTGTVQFGIGSSTALYGVTEGAGQTSPIVLASLGSVSLTSTGLTFSANTVPLPAAIWLLGSGLLGLAGVGRRKSAAV
jgi:hypothetical protein